MLQKDQSQAQSALSSGKIYQEELESQLRQMKREFEQLHQDNERLLQENEDLTALGADLRAQLSAYLMQESQLKGKIELGQNDLTLLQGKLIEKQ